MELKELYKRFSVSQLQHARKYMQTKKDIATSYIAFWRAQRERGNELPPDVDIRRLETEEWLYAVAEGAIAEKIAKMTAEPCDQCKRLAEMEGDDRVNPKNHRINHCYICGRYRKGEYK